MKSKISLYIFLIPFFTILFTISYAQMQSTTSFDMTEIYSLRSQIKKNLTVSLPDGSHRNMSRCGFVVLNPEVTHIDPELDILHRTSIRTIPVAFHIIHKTDATGYIQQSKLDAQITALNNAYSSLNIQFQKSSVDYRANDDWFGINCGNFTETV